MLFSFLFYFILLYEHWRLATTTSENYLLIKEEVRKVLSKAKAAGVLRLVFHDAGTFDMDENSGIVRMKYYWDAL